MKIAISSHIKVKVLLYFNVHMFIRKLKHVPLALYCVGTAQLHTYMKKEPGLMQMFCYVHDQKEAR